MGLLERLMGLEGDPPAKKKPLTETDLYKDGMSARGKALFESPLADSLYRTDSKPAKIGELLGGYNLRGTYDRENGGELRVAVDGEMDEGSTLRHEMGHRFADSNRRSEKNKEGWRPAMYDYPTKAPEGATPLEKEAHAKLDWYGKTGGIEEAYADAYRNAFLYLSDTQRDPTGFREQLGKIEGINPGTGEIVRRLLKTDTFKNHQLKATLLGWQR